MDQLSAEVSVLGACLMEPGAIGEVADFLKPSDFYSEPHREIYSSMLELWKVGEPVSDPTVTAQLSSRKKLKLAGGASYICQLSMDFPDVANIDFYAKEVKRAALMRTLKNVGKSLETAEGDPHEILNGIMERLVDASASSLRSVPQSLGEYTTRVKDLAIAIWEGEGKRDVIKTGMNKFDEVTSGLSPSDLIIIGAQPSVGKSAFALWIAKLVTQQSLPVLFISLEMSGEQIGTRMLAADSGIRYTLIQDGYGMDGTRKDLLNESNDRLKLLPFIIDDKAGQSISDIRTKAMRENVRNGLALIIVDYLQIACKDPSDVSQVAMVSTGLKNIAKDLKIPVIALSQLSRSIDHRDSKEPVLSDLKQSSQLEQDADLVGFLYFKDRRKMNDLSLVIKKHRNGPLGEVEFHFDKDCQRFEETGGRIG